MKNLVGYDGKVSDDLLKKLFLDRMPADMRLTLAACYELNVYNLAAKADSKTFTVFDQNNNLNFLVDSGSSMSLIPTYLSRRFHVCTPATQSVRMKCASGKTITSESEVFLHLKLNCGSFSWNFRVCDVRECILGVIFFITLAC